MANTEISDLYVFEFGGTGRSGKNTIVSHLAETYPGIATEETGRDYRVVTKKLLLDGVIELDMPDEVVTKTVDNVGAKSLTDIVSEAHSFVSQHGVEAIHSDDVNKLVGVISPVQALRSAVKSGFQNRIEKKRDDDNYGILLVDGRNLAPVVRGVAGVELVMRTFVTCESSEAARREILRQRLSIETSEAREMFRRQVELIEKRNDHDRNRSIDPVIPDEDAIDYWKDPWILDMTAQRYADEYFGGDYMESLDQLNVNQRNMKDVFRIGVGTEAASHDRQIYFDTTPFFASYVDSKNAMLTAADQMFMEALMLI